MKKTFTILALAASLAPWCIAQSASTSPATTAQSTDQDLDFTQLPTATAVTGNSANISWSTSTQSSALVKYGTDRSNLAQTAEAGWGGPQHQVTLSNLQPNTTYYYQVVSGDAKGNGTGAMSAIQTLRTGAAGSAAATAASPTPAPAATATASANGQDHVQAGPVVQSITDTTANLWWMGTVDTTPTVKYGTTQNAMDQTAVASSGREHRAQLTGLQPSTTYYFQVSENGQTSNGKFLTEGADYSAQAAKLHITKGPVIEYLTKDSAIVAWSTNRQASTLVRYGTDPNNLNRTAEAPWGQETHRVTVRNLQPDTKYYFVVESSQAQGTGAMAKSMPAPFQTVAAGQQAMTTSEQH